MVYVFKATKGAVSYRQLTHNTAAACQVAAVTNTNWAPQTASVVSPLNLPKMLLNGNSIFQLRYGRYTDMVAGSYAEVLEAAAEIVKMTDQTVSIFCEGTASVWSTVTPLSLANRLPD